MPDLMKKYALCIPLLRHQLLLFLLLVLTLHANLRFLLKSRRALKTDEHVPLVRSSTLHPLQCSLTFPIFQAGFSCWRARLSRMRVANLRALYNEGQCRNMRAGPVIE